MPALGRAAGFALIAYAFLITMVGATLPTPLYPLYQAKYDLGELMVTVIFAIYAFGVLAGLLLFGALSDEVGRRPMLLLGIGFSALSSVLFAVAGSLGPIYAGRAISGLSAGIFTGTATATLVDLAPGGQRRLATLVAVFVNLGGLGSGTLLAGVIADHTDSPLRLPFLVHLALLAPALVGVFLTPETVERRRFRFQLQRVGVPAEVRAVFVRGAASGFASFAVGGVYSSVAPAFLGQVLGHHSHALAGLLVFILFGTSIVGQLALSRLTDRQALGAGCLLLAGGVGLLALGLGIESLATLLVSAAVVGIGQGLVIGAGLAAINQRAPVERRGETASSFFVVLYVGLSVPVIGTGLLAQAWSLRTAGMVFSAAVAALVLAVFASLGRSDRPSASASAA